MNKGQPPDVKTLNVVYLLWPLENDEEEESDESITDEDFVHNRFQEEPTVIRKIERYLVFSAN